jgi:hypothetical protein
VQGIMYNLVPLALIKTQILAVQAVKQEVVLTNNKGKINFQKKSKKYNLKEVY